MKDWLSIGEFSKLVGVSTRTLRVYEAEGLIISHARGENGYRYYLHSQVERMTRILEFKRLGFSLGEICAMLATNGSFNTARLHELLLARKAAIATDRATLSRQNDEIDRILKRLAILFDTSLNTDTVALMPRERRFIMSQFEKISIVVTGTSGLEKTARLIQKQLTESGSTVPVIAWNEKTPAQIRPSILILPEENLADDTVQDLAPDIVVIKNISAANEATRQRYLHLYKAAGPHMTTVFNADDQLSIQLAAEPEIKKGRIFYFSKNAALEPQISRIGGVISDGESIKIYNFNQVKSEMNLTIGRPLAFDEEIALLASLGAVLDLGIQTLSI